MKEEKIVEQIRSLILELNGNADSTENHCAKMKAIDHLEEALFWYGKV